MIGAGGLLYCLDTGIDIPGQVGLAGFNGLELLDGLPRQLATMDACRSEIGRKAASIVARRASGEDDSTSQIIELTPQLETGDTLLR